MRTVFDMFFRAPVGNPWLVLLCLLLAGLAGGIGIASVLPILSVALDGAGGQPSAISQAVNDAFAAIGLTPRLEILIALMILAIAAKAGLTLLAMRYVGNASATLAARMRLQLVKHLLDAQWRFFTGNRVGRLSHAISGEATRAASSYMIAANFFANAIQASVYVIIALFISWRLAIAAVVLGALIAASLHFLVRAARKAGRQEAQRMIELSSLFSDTINNIKPLKAMARQAPYVAFLETKIRKVKRALRKQALTGHARKAVEEVLVAIFLGIALYGTLVFLEYGFAQVAVMALLLMRTMNHLNKIQAEFQKSAVVETAYLSFKELLAKTEAARERLSGGDKPSLGRRIDFDRVSFGYGDKPVLRDISFEIPVGQSTVLTGPSGGGKTTIVDLLVGLYEPDRGHIRVDGTSLGELDLLQWRRMIGYVPQDVVLLHDTIAANITLGATWISEAEVIEALEAAEAWSFVRELPEGVHTTVGERGVKLSGGQRQRIALARGLVTRPKLIILDEVTSALDPETEQAICRSVRALPKDVAVLSITHRPAFLDIADRVYRIQDGRAEEVTFDREDVTAITTSM